MLAATGLSLAGLPSVSVAEQSTTDEENLDQISVEELNEDQIEYHLNETSQLNDANAIIDHFKSEGWDPVFEETKAVKSINTETEDSAITLQIPFDKESELDQEEYVYLQRSTATDIDSELVGVHAVSQDDESPHSKWNITEHYIEKGEVIEEEQYVDLENPYANPDPDGISIQIFGCPNSKINLSGLTKMAADYSITFIACGTCAGSGTVFVPSCGVCVAQIARTTASLDDYNWCECDPQSNC